MKLNLRNSIKCFKFANAKFDDVNRVFSIAYRFLLFFTLFLVIEKNEAFFSLSCG